MRTTPPSVGAAGGGCYSVTGPALLGKQVLNKAPGTNEMSLVIAV